MSLFKFAESPTSTPNPLPALDARKVRQVDGFPSAGAWPVALLPGREIAADLARLGVTFRRGAGYAVDGRRVSPEEVGDLVVLVLDLAADELPLGRRETAALRLRLASEQLAIAESRTLDLLDRAAADGVPGLEMASRDVYIMSTFTLRGMVADAKRDLATLPDDPEPSWRPWASALRATAAELRASSAARRLVLSRVLPYLPAPAPGVLDTAPVDAFLAALDGRDVVRRSELPGLYEAARCPGGLSPADLRAAAADRWGDPVRRRGIFVYRPASAASAVATS